jgi:hypothetical protein
MRKFGSTHKMKKWQGSGESCVMRSLIICMQHKLLWSDQIKGHNMGRAHSIEGREENGIQSICKKSRKAVM